jgi:hypothetical protein
MTELNNEELDLVTGAGWLRDMFDDVEYITENINRLYGKTIKATADMMCTATGNC